MISQPVLFCIFKHALLDHMQTSEACQITLHALAEFNFRMLWACDPIFLASDFWRAHYHRTIELKERNIPGDGARFERKILLKHSNSWGLPLLVENMEDTDISKRKNQLRQALYSRLNIPKELRPNDLLHISDDTCNAYSELVNLKRYVSVEHGGWADALDEFAEDVMSQRIHNHVIPVLSHHISIVQKLLQKPPCTAELVDQLAVTSTLPVPIVPANTPRLSSDSVITIA